MKNFMKNLLQEKQLLKEKIANRQRQALADIFENPSGWSKKDFRAILHNISWVYSILENNPKKNPLLKDYHNKIKDCEKRITETLQDIGYKQEYAKRIALLFFEIGTIAFAEKNAKNYEDYEKLKNLLIEQNENLCSAIANESLKFRTKSTIILSLEQSLKRHFPD